MPLCLGLDIAKSKIDAPLLLENDKFKIKSKLFSNTPKGFAQLRDWRADHNAVQVPVCMEATGVYHEAVAT